MEKTLLNEFNEYEKLIKTDIKNLNSLSTTTILPLILKQKIKFEDTDSIEKLEKSRDNSVEATNNLLNSLSINKDNQSTLKFIFHEIISNIYDHSEFDNSFIMGKKENNYFDFSFIDDGISIPTSFKNNNYPFKKDFEAIIKALNGFSTKNEFGYIERGTGLNNTTNIVTNGFEGDCLIVSKCGLVFITKNELKFEEIPKNCIDGTLISFRMKVDKKIDIYKYLKQIKYEY